MKKTWPQILAFRFLPKAPPCSTRTPHTKCVTQSQDSMCFPCLKCIISSFSPLLWDKLALKEKADGKAGQRKQPMAVQACKSNWIHKLCAIRLPLLQKLCPKISFPTPHSRSTQDDHQSLQEVTKLATMLMDHLCQRPSQGQTQESQSGKKLARIVMPNGFQIVCSAEPQDFSRTS